MNTFEAARLRGSITLENLPLAEASAQRAAEMVSQLMLFASSETTPGHGMLDLLPVLHSIVEIGRRSFDPSIILKIQTPARLPPISGEASQLDQVFLNLLLNAKDAVEKAEQSASHISVTVEEVSLDEKEEAMHPSTLGPYLRVNVTDDGIGMDEDTRLRVFEPFFTTKEIGQGTGLGLATVYAIINQHDGWIECQSQPGVGTTFSVYLPVATDQSPAPEVEAARTVKGGSETILFVEDEQDVRQSFIGALQSFGYRVLVAEDGLEGWTVFQEHQKDIDLILLDLSMPNMSGQELLSHIRAVEPAAKVIISSGTGIDLPGETILKKPYGISDALTTIRDTLDEEIVG
jgi:two-component system cell cycle sensor histidine kinase/response regulator CckA